MNEIEVLEKMTSYIQLWASHNRRSYLIMVEANVTEDSWFHEKLDLSVLCWALFETDLAR